MRFFFFLQTDKDFSVQSFFSSVSPSQFLDLLLFALYSLRTAASSAAR
jgi:hypothetical protein